MSLELQGEDRACMGITAGLLSWSIDEWSPGIAGRLALTVYSNEALRTPQAQVQVSRYLTQRRVSPIFVLLIPEWDSKSNGLCIKTLSLLLYPLSVISLSFCRMVKIIIEENNCGGLIL
jgi:hypothetical protein